MAFPTSLQDLDATRGTASQTLASPSHVTHHALEDSTIEALEAKVGADSSAVTTSHDYKLSEVTSSDKAVGKTAQQTLTQKTLTSPTLTTPTINIGSDAAGDIYYRHTDGTLKRLAKGNDGDALKLASGVPSWQEATAVENASTTVKGIVEIATDAEMTAGTDTGGTGAKLVLSASSAGTAGAYKLVQYDSAGKLPAVDGSQLTLINSFMTASANLKLSADTERGTISGSYTKLKEIVLGRFGGLTVKFSLKASANQATGRVYKNGVALGTERITTSTSYVEYSENFIGLIPGDKIQIYAFNNGADYAYVNNFRLYFDNTFLTDGSITID